VAELPPEGSSADLVAENARLFRNASAAQQQASIVHTLLVHSSTCTVGMDSEDVPTAAHVVSTRA